MVENVNSTSDNQIEQQHDSNPSSFSVSIELDDGVSKTKLYSHASTLEKKTPIELKVKKLIFNHLTFLFSFVFFFRIR